MAITIIVCEALNNNKLHIVHSFDTSFLAISTFINYINQYSF